MSLLPETLKLNQSQSNFRLFCCKQLSGAFRVLGIPLSLMTSRFRHRTGSATRTCRRFVCSKTNRRLRNNKRPKFAHQTAINMKIRLFLILLAVEVIHYANCGILSKHSRMKKNVSENYQAPEQGRLPKAKPNIMNMNTMNKPKPTLATTKLSPVLVGKSASDEERPRSSPRPKDDVIITTTADENAKRDCKFVSKIFMPDSNFMDMIRRSYGEEYIQHVLKIAKVTIKRLYDFDLSLYSYPKDYEESLIKNDWDTAEGLEDEKKQESSYDRILTSFFLATKGFKRSVKEIPLKMARSAAMILKQHYSNFAFDLAQGDDMGNQTMSADQKPIMDKCMEILTYQAKRFCNYSVLRYTLMAIAEDRLNEDSE